MHIAQPLCIEIEEKGNTKGAKLERLLCNFVLCIHTYSIFTKKCMEIHLAKYMISQRESITTYILVIQYITQKINVWYQCAISSAEICNMYRN